MLKKIILVGAVLATSTGIAFANSAPYIGASLGVNTNTADVKASGSNYTGGDYRGVPFNLFAGYATILGQNGYLAGEVFGTAGTADLSNDTQLKTSYSYGVAAIPGLLLSDHTLAYLRAGVLRSRFTNQTTSQVGGQFGFGMQTSLMQNVDLRGEYDFVTYSSFNSTSGSASASVSPRADQFTLGLVYKFD